MARQPKPWYRKDRRAWFVTVDGKRHNLGRDKKRAHETFYRLMRHPQPRVAAESVAAIIDTFLEWTQRHRSAASYEWYRHRLQRFVDRYPNLLVGDLRPYHVQEWVDAYPDHSVTTRRNYLRTVKRCMKWATQQGYIESNPIEHLEVPRGERKDVFVTPQEYDRLLSYCVDESFRELIVTTWETGCRPQELLRVEARHVDVPNSRWIFPPAEAKGKKAPRVVYLTEKALAVTLRRMQEHPTGPLFRNSRGEPWRPDAVNCGFDRIRHRMGSAELKRQQEVIADPAVDDFAKTLKPTHIVKGQEVKKSPARLRTEARTKLRAQRVKALVPRYSLYALRHSWATRALQSGKDGLTVAILMGHSDPSTLARVYQHLSHNPQHLLQQARQVQG